MTGTVSTNERHACSAAERFWASVPPYHVIEARVGDDVEATVVRTVEAGSPADVDLRLPAGEGEQTGGGAAPGDRSASNRAPE